MADHQAMMAPVIYCAGFVIMSLILLGMTRLLGQSHLMKPVVFMASGCLVSAAWLGSRYDMSLFCAALQGALIAPACLLPVFFALSGRIEGLTRAATGLGANSGTRLRYLWFPLLRLPIMISTAIFLACLATSLFLASHAHG